MTIARHIAHEARTGFFKRLASVNRASHISRPESSPAISGPSNIADGLTTELQRRRHDTTLPAADATESKWMRVTLVVILAVAFWGGVLAVVLG